MRVAEILRQLADLVDQTENTAGQAAGMEQPQAEPEACAGETGTGEITVTQLEPVDVDSEDGTDPNSLVSPLQQEHELLKKSQGVENNVSEFASEEGAVEEGSAEEEEWRMAMGHDGDDPEEMIGQPDDDEDEAYESELAQMKKVAGIGEQSKPTDYGSDIRGGQSVNPRAQAALDANGKTDSRVEYTKHQDQK